MFEITVGATAMIRIGTRNNPAIISFPTTSPFGILGVSLLFCFLPFYRRIVTMCAHANITPPLFREERDFLQPRALRLADQHPTIGTSSGGYVAPFATASFRPIR